MAILATTRAMRHLAPDPIPGDLIRSVIEAATWAPSGGNWQPVEYVVVGDREKMARIAALWPQLAEDFYVFLAATGANEGLATDPSHRKTAAAVAYQREHFADTPVLIVVCENTARLGKMRGAFGTF